MVESNIIWHPITEAPPTMENLLIAIKGQSADPVVLVEVGWRILPLTPWISNNGVVSGKVIAWAHLPGFPEDGMV